MANGRRGYGCSCWDWGGGGVLLLLVLGGVVGEVGAAAAAASRPALSFESFDDQSRALIRHSGGDS